MAGVGNGEIRLFCSWFQTLNPAERSWFLDRLLPLATPNKLFARLERSSLGGARSVLPTTWEDCDFQQQALFCVARVGSWSAGRANSFINSLENIDQEAVYEFYKKIVSANREP